MVKEKKTAATVAGSPDDTPADGDVSAFDESMVANGYRSARNGDGEEPPSKKVRREAGDEVDDDEDGDGMDGEDDADDGAENEGDEVEDEDEAMEDDEDHFEDAVEEVEDDEQVARDGMMDEALDDGEESD